MQHADLAGSWHLAATTVQTAMQLDGQGFVYVMPEWIPVQLDDPF